MVGRADGWVVLRWRRSSSRNPRTLIVRLEFVRALCLEQNVWERHCRASDLDTQCGVCERVTPANTGQPEMRDFVAPSRPEKKTAGDERD
jgi:hypothetical protein